MGNSSEAVVEKNQNIIIAKIIIGSLLGIFVFMVPITWQGEMTIPLWLLKDLISMPFGPAITYLVLGFIIISAVGSTVVTIGAEKKHSEFVETLFKVKPVMIVVRWLAVALYVIACFQLGPEELWNENTGGLIATDLMPAMMGLFFVASVLLPLLTDFGLMELMGHVLRPIFRPLFKLPGHSSVLALSSWFGSGTVGMLQADEEYNRGYFTGREASILCFGFCTIPLPSIFVYTTTIGGLDGQYFLYFFLCCCVVAIVSTIIMSRTPPLSLVPNTKSEKAEELLVEEKESFSDALKKAYQRAAKAKSPWEMLKSGAITCLRLYIDVFPLVILLATIVLVIAEYTTIFDIISIPFVPALNALQIPEAQAVAPALLIGFADLLLPFLAATSVSSQLAKFIICVVGTVQIICMSETGAVLLKTDIPVKFGTIVIAFLEKTVIALLIALVMGRMIGLT